MARHPMELKLVARNQLLGPLPLEELAEMVADGRIDAEDLVRPVGSGTWLRVAEVSLLAARLAARPSPPPVAGPSASPSLARAVETAVEGGEGEGYEEHEEHEEDEFLEAGGADARVWRPRRKRPEEATMEMAPMIDVTFLLLIFFMLTNTLANPASIAVPEAVHGRGVTLEGQQLILVGERGEYFLGETATETSRADSLEALVAEVTKNVRATPIVLDVIVSAHKDVKHAHVRKLIEALAAIDDLGQIFIGVEEKLD